MTWHRRRRPRFRPEAWVPDIEEDGYAGPARLSVVTPGEDRGEVEVEVTVAGHLEPLDGQYHWYGRVQQDAILDRAKANGATEVVLSIAGGQPSPARLAEHDAWGNLRITGVGQPPFGLEPVEVDVLS